MFSLLKSLVTGSNKADETIIDKPKKVKYQTPLLSLSNDELFQLADRRVFLEVIKPYFKTDVVLHY